MTSPGPVELRDGTTANDPRLDCLQQWDERNERFLAVERLTGEVDVTPRRGKTWAAGVPLDQDPDVVRARTRLARAVTDPAGNPLDLALDTYGGGGCVGFALATEAAADPVPVHRTDSLALTLLAMRAYRLAQRYDPWPETGPGGEEGSSIQAGARAGRELGLFDGYLWARSVDELPLILTRPVGRDARTVRPDADLVPRGPVIAGVDWYRSMFTPDPDTGMVVASGPLDGRHAIVIRGVMLHPRNAGLGVPPGEEVYRLRNTWDQWGKGGDCLMTASTLRSILGPRPELMVAATRRRPPA